MIRQTLLATAVLVAGTVAASCADQSTAPTAPDAARVASPSDASATSKVPPGLGKSGRATLLTNVPVTGALSDGGTFVGTFTAKHIDYDEATKSLVMTGVLTGTATTVAGQISTVTQQFTAPFTLKSSSSATTASIYQHTQGGTCSILFLDLGPLHLDLLGLTVDLNEVVLALNAVSGASNLLGNLLCAVVNLLDAGAIIGTIQNLLNVINNILAGLQLPTAVSGVGLVMPGFLSPGIGFSSRA